MGRRGEWRARARGPARDGSLGSRGSRVRLGARPVRPGSCPETHFAEDTSARQGFSARCSGAIVARASPTAWNLAPRRSVRSPCRTSCAPPPSWPSPSSSPHAAARPGPPRRPPRRVGTADVPGGSPTDSPAAADGLDHPTGATDIVLRYDVGGGFMIAGLAASQVPIFTLYGDGTVVFRKQSRRRCRRSRQRHARPTRLRMAKLSESQIQDLLGPAIGQGGLGVAREQYDNPMVMDVGTDHVRDRRGRSQEGGLASTPWVWSRRASPTCPPAGSSVRSPLAWATSTRAGPSPQTCTSRRLPRHPHGRDRHGGPGCHRVAVGRTSSRPTSRVPPTRTRSSSRPAS